MLLMAAGGAVAQTDWEDNVTAQPSSSDLHQQIGEENLEKVVNLTLTGTINGYDFMILRNKMPNLQNLDMTDVSIVANSYEYYTGCHSEDNVLGANLFRGVSNLVSIKLPKTIEKIGDYAFASNDFGKDTNLKSVTAYRGIKALGDYAFHYCVNLKSVQLEEGLESIGEYAFDYCKALEEIVLPEGLKDIKREAFNDCENLTKVVLPSTLERIGGDSFANGSCFQSCGKLKTINFPPHLKYIGYYCFRFCYSLSEIHLPSTLQSIGESAFAYCDNLNDIYVYTMEPTAIAQNSFSTWSTATLHIPALSYYNYYWDTQWSQFAHLVIDHDYTYEYFYIGKDFVFDDEKANMGSVPDVDLNAGAGLIVETTDATVSLNNVTLADNGTYAASILADGNLTMNSLALEANRWYFFSVPFRVKRSAITAPGDFALRYYDGQERATNGRGGWKDYTGDYLIPGQGYIVQTNAAGTLSLPVEKADMDFSGTDRSVALAAYASASKQNASWNYVGNPHIAYYDIDATDYTAPITVWNGSNYIAVRPGDDHYHLGPLQGFFVQKPEEADQMLFPATGRHTYRQWIDTDSPNQAPRRHAASQRAQTRVVFNNEKSADYEMDCDAAKFFADGTVQLYSTDGQNSYAINERPAGEVKLAYTAITETVLTIAAARMDCPMLLHDLQENITHDLSAGGYTFHTDAGSFENRFVLVQHPDITGIANLRNSQQDEDGQVYSLTGVRMNGKPKTGICIVNKNGVATKIVTR